MAKAKEPMVSATVALGAVIVVTIYMFSMVASYAADPDLFTRQLFYFAIMVGLIVFGIILFDLGGKKGISLDYLALDGQVLISTIVAGVTVAGLVFMSMVKLNLLSIIPAMISVLPSTQTTVYHLFFVGASEGMLQYFFIRALSLQSLKIGKVGGVFAAALILSVLHTPAYGFSPTLIWIFLMFTVLGLLSLLPSALGSKVEISAFVIIFGHFVNNILVPIAGSLVAGGVIH